MENPWCDLPHEPPYILKSDLARLELYNATLPASHRFHFDLLPEPFLGAVTEAPVLLLYMNPAFSIDEYRFHNNYSFRSTALRNLRHEPLEYPLYFLEPLADASPGHCKWTEYLHPLLNACGDRKLVAQKVAVIEWYPYHALGMSRSGPGPLLESQPYSFKLVEAAIARAAVIVIVRAVGWWEKAIPALRCASNVYVVREKYRQTGKVTPTSCPDGFAAAVGALR